MTLFAGGWLPIDAGPADRDVIRCNYLTSRVRPANDGRQTGASCGLMSDRDGPSG